jgi:phospholipid-binding lipoprotein MlaA
MINKGNSMKSLLFLFTISILSFQGCSTKLPITPEHTQQKETLQDTKTFQKNSLTNTEFDTEFEDEEEAIIDPLSGYNTFMTSFNDIFITYALNPVSEVYGYIIPQPIRIGISNAFHNIQFPIRFANNLLQGKFQNASDETERFIVNSTVGLAGLMDPAQEYMHIPKHNEDFGQTLGYYGVDSGFHIVLPFFGPSNVRDFLGISVDAYASPLVNVRGLENYKIPNNFAQSTAIVAGYLINKNSLELGQYESLKKDALELYPFLRDIYEQKRTADIEE